MTVSIQAAIFSSVRASVRTGVRRVAKLGGTVAIASTLLLTAACEPELDDVEADAPVPTEQASVPADAEVTNGDADVSELIGETVTVSTEVTEKISDNLFTIYDVESLRGEEMLAITDLPVPEAGSNIEVTGEVMELDEAAIKSAYGVELEPEVVEAYTGKPYLAVQALEAVD